MTHTPQDPRAAGHRQTCHACASMQVASERSVFPVRLIRQPVIALVDLPALDWDRYRAWLRTLPFAEAQRKMVEMCRAGF